jgi:SAM-dependent methyltransferase
MNKQFFWDKKILGWESDKYTPPEGQVRRFFDANQSLKYRKLIAQNVLRQVVKGKSVLEIGCGTARLLPSIMEAGATKYVGVDISSVAIEEAKAGHQALLGKGNVELFQSDAISLEKVDADICVSLGLLDWLDLAEIQQMLARVKCQYYFHSFSERRRSIQQIAHKMYIYLFYGHRTKTYVPRYYTEQQIREVFSPFSEMAPDIFRSPKLSFGAFIHHLPRNPAFQ